MENYFYVVTRTYFDLSMKELALAIAKRTYPIFESQPGFIRMIPVVSQDNSHMSTLIIWASKKDHEDCMQSPDFQEINKEWEGLLGKEGGRFELNTYELIQ